MKKLAALLASGALLVVAPAATAANGVSHSQGASAHGNAISFEEDRPAPRSTLPAAHRTGLPRRLRD